MEGLTLVGLFTEGTTLTCLEINSDAKKRTLLYTVWQSLSSLVIFVFPFPLVQKKSENNFFLSFQVNISTAVKLMKHFQLLSKCHRAGWYAKSRVSQLKVELWIRKQSPLRRKSPENLQDL
jgi:hypothetical protein